MSGNAAVRGNSLKHGRRAKAHTPEQIKTRLLTKIHPDAPEILEAAFAIAAETGNLSEMNVIGARALFDAEILRRASVAAIRADGVTVEDTVKDREGNVQGVKLRAHPLLEHVTALAGQLGFTADQMQLSNKSKGEGARDQAAAAFLVHRAKLSALRGRMLEEETAPIDVSHRSLAKRR